MLRPELSPPSETEALKTIRFGNRNMLEIRLTRFASSTKSRLMS